MRRRGRNPNENPGVKPVQKIELSEKHVRLRIVGVVILLAIGVGFIAYAVGSFFGKSNGWREITVNPSADASCADELIFQYYLGYAGMSATAEYKAIAAEYTDACILAHRLFDCINSYGALENISYINAHPNSIIKVEDVLYNAFELCEEHGSRVIYGGPIYEVYKNLFFCYDDHDASEFDALTNPEVAGFFAEVERYISDPESVRLELLGEGRVRLYVSEEYLAYAKEQYISTYIDFFWMKNAFIVDYIADRMIAKGYTLGNISSYDGFIRNLDTGENAYSFNIIDKPVESESAQYVAGRMDYVGSRSIVYLRTYPLSELDDEHYYVRSDGQVRHPYIDLSDGLCRSSLCNYIGTSRSAGCAEVLLSVMPGFISETFDPGWVAELAERGIFGVYCIGFEIFSNDPTLSVNDPYSRDGVEYRVAQK